MLKLISKILTFSLLLSLSLATSPIPPPYYSYNISGSVVCDSLADLSEYAIVLFGKIDNTYFDSVYVTVPGMENSFEQPIGRTNLLGNFKLRVNSPFLFDSVKTGVITSNKPVILSIAYSIDKNNLQEITETYTPNSGSGCTSCSVESTETRTVRYIYNLSNILLHICN